MVNFLLVLFEVIWTETKLRHGKPQKRIKGFSSHYERTWGYWFVKWFVKEDRVKTRTKCPQVQTAKELLPKNMLGLVNEWMCVCFF